MPEQEAGEEIRRALEAIAEAASGAARRLPELADSLAEGARLRERAAKLEADLGEALTRLEGAEGALSRIEGAVAAAVEAAKDAVHDPGVPVESKEGMIALCRSLFDRLAEAGFRVIIPSPGDSYDTEEHVAKGSAKSRFGGDRVADVVAWGYRFPGGSGKAAEVLIGDGSLGQTEQEPPRPPRKGSRKAGIAMVLDEEAGGPAGRPPRRDAGQGTFFDDLARAAERNVDRGD